MSMFERLGEKVERFKQEAVSARDDGVTYRCRNCDEGFYSEQETCPSCGSTEVERVAPETETDTDTEGGPEAEISTETAPEPEPETDSNTDANTE
ncbi:zinc ribbon domain-containing protein [Natronorubrum halophilum]|uniref:zinc ribbon domain-containing protein n=1 Tax=Natronorubrum halophilum TaxID=1702106 RepID=UPI000EF7264F|nr:zinc ribbon domain-containing protein [Natronorubrum halophilum]